MKATKPAHGLDYPFAKPPETGQIAEVAPGMLWVRIPLPFQLDHVNIFLVADDGGWAVIDTGIDNAATRAAWEALMAGPLKGERLTRLIVTHYHPDHIGLAGWLCQRFELPLFTSQTSYLGCLNISLSPGALDAKVYRDFYLRNGLDQAATDRVATQGHGYLKMVSGLPPTFRRLVAGDTLRLGGRDFAVMTGDGHAPEQVMLHCKSDNLFLAADQVLAKISPNVSVWAVEPDGNPLGLYLRSLKGLKRGLPEDVLVLPGHQLPFRGLRQRIKQLADHHEVRCTAIDKACRERPRSVAELLPVVFHRPLDPHQLSFAFSEVFAHVNHMLHDRRLAWAETERGTARVVAC